MLPYHFYNNYISFFFNYELIVMLCFFFFLFSIILLEKGQLGSYLQELEIEAKSKLSRLYSLLEIRESLIQELSLHLDRAMSEMRRIMLSCDTTCQDILLSLQQVTRESSNTDTMLQIKYRLEAVVIRTQFLSLEMKRYLKEDLFGPNKRTIFGTERNGALLARPTQPQATGVPFRNVTVSAKSLSKLELL